MTRNLTISARLAAFAACLAAGATVLAQAPTATRRGLTLDGAKAVAAAASAEARRLNAGGAIAIVDEGGNLVYLERLENTFPAASTVAFEKARTAATFRRPTRDFENAIVKGGRVSLVAVDVMTPLQGGVPILVDGALVGAIGVSGAMSAQQDDDIATVAAGALAGTSTTMTHISGTETRAAFEKGKPLLENASYKVHASRREAPGQAEVHVRDTDILYVLEGTATIVTGGTAVSTKSVAQDELRGPSIEGGKTTRLAKGDVLVVPNGTAHQFTEVSAPFLYYVVKVTS